MGKLEGKVACITGGTRSIGRGMADAFLARGRQGRRQRTRRASKGKQCLAEMDAGDDADILRRRRQQAGRCRRTDRLHHRALRPARHLLPQLRRRAADRAGRADDRRGVEARDRLEPQPRVLGHAPGAPAHDPADVRPDHRDVVGRGQARQAGHPRVCDDEARRQRARQGGRRRRSARRASRSTRSCRGSSRPTSCARPVRPRRR